MCAQSKRKFTNRLKVLVGIAISSFLLFFMTVWLVLAGQTTRFDQQADLWLGDPTDKGIAFMYSVSFFGSSKFVLGCYLVLVAGLLIQRMKFAAMVTALSGITGYLTVALLKEALQRPRPSLPLVKPLTNFSLPSGHACSGFLLYALLGYFLWNSRLPGPVRIILIILLLLFSFFIGVTRIYLHLHYASDVVAGFFLAILFTCIAFAVMERKKIILE
jgi:undecaprenyl-diphosphatase